jgi:glycosyltransferase involved in cell wall biosynthesis
VTGPKIRVVHIVTQLELGGAQQNTLYTVEHLDRGRFEVTLLCGTGGYLDEEARRRNVSIRFLRHLVRPVSPVHDALAIPETVRILRQIRPHIVHTHSSKAGILGRWAARAAGVPVIIHTFHGFGFTPEQPALVRGFYKALEKLTARVTTGLVAVSQANQAEALAAGIGRPEKYRLIRSGVSLEVFQSLSRTSEAPAGLDIEPQHRLVTTVGPFKPQKNLGDFLAAAALVRSAMPESRFLVVGDGALRPFLEKRVRDLGLSDAVFLPGWRRDLPAILARTDVFVMTSLWEGLPRALVEALAAGIPAVANRVDGVADVIHDGENGCLVAPRQPAETAQRVLSLLKAPEAARRMGEKARQSISRDFDIGLMVKQQEKLYLDMTSKIL